MKTHVVIIRMHYPDGDSKFEWRFAYFRSVVLPRLLKQTRSNFDIAIRCNPVHAERFKALSNRIIPFCVKDEKSRYIKRAGSKKRYFVDFVPWKDVIGLKKYDIQTGIDSDDLIAKDYIEIIQNQVDSNDPKRSLHISFQPGIFDLWGLEKKPIGIKYRQGVGSAFLSIYQPNKDKYMFVYEHSHLKIGRLLDRSIVLPEGHCWASVHGLNISTIRV